MSLIKKMMLIFLFCPCLAFGSPLSDAKSNLFQQLADREQGKAPVETMEGMIMRITDSESVWVRIDNRREYRKWTYKLSTNSLDVDRQEIRVYLSYVSPKDSVSRGKKYNDWFKNNVAYQMGKNFYGRRVRIDYELQDKTFRLIGMVWVQDTNINLWLVKNGLSFYLLGEVPSPYHQDFLDAEQSARQNKLGLWKNMPQAK
ncbi:thermonuclease family protein [Deltaproteobacteria bacterium TL4]